MKIQQWLLALFLVLSTSTALAQRQHLEIIPLQHRSVAEILPALQSLAPAKASVTASGQKLLIRADSRDINVLRLAVEELDQPRQSLLVSIRFEHTEPSNPETPDKRRYSSHSPERFTSQQVLDGHELIVRDWTTKPVLVAGARRQRGGHGTEGLTLAEQSQGTYLQLRPTLLGNNRLQLQMAWESTETAPGYGDTTSRGLVATRNIPLDRWVPIVTDKSQLAVKPGVRRYGVSDVNTLMIRVSLNPQ
ncbi:hypothetical protein HBA55_16390 [Pseudomaricurvus alkylphenolicus]|uniref:secretin N-terminal domain-containing protein n=1 Tax=Pseudomaricurvus alkylphenolicus TaxID=1306991 RepID=UPI001422C0AF|nr:secretin N-terminal domain-containing protein [Pseudomaricurvus alkylphenolicus]NIB41184.1 hypothetical protein [Pseudomaricurvus alkylphenolicus]